MGILATYVLYSYFNVDIGWAALAGGFTWGIVSEYRKMLKADEKFDSELESIDEEEFKKAYRKKRRKELKKELDD